MAQYNPFPPKHMINIYGAGKTWAAENLRDLRDNHGFNIISRWIDIQHVLKGPEDTFNYESDEMKSTDLGTLWDKGCKMDSTFCDLNLTLAQEADGEMHSGSLVELGQTSACFAYIQIQKPVYVIGSCRSFEQVGHSDRAWKFQRCFHHFPDLDYIAGAEAAIKHYQQHYALDWVKWRKYLIKNDMIKAMHEYCGVYVDKERLPSAM